MPPKSTKRKQESGEPFPSKTLKSPQIDCSNPFVLTGNSLESACSQEGVEDLCQKSICRTGTTNLSQDPSNFAINSKLLEKDPSQESITDSWFLQSKTCDIAEEFLRIMEEFSKKLEELKFSQPISYIYNPLIYAKETHDCFIRRYCNSKKKVLFLGMNPGPYGMAQNGVPFGEQTHVVEWLQISGKVQKPSREHPKRPITGLDCSRSEVSGKRFWGLWKDLCTTPDKFFSNGFVYNHCPLVFMTDSGKNVTPPKIKVNERKPLNALCDEMLVRLFRLLGVEVVVGIGKFAEERSKKVLAKEGIDNIKVKCIMHPSPANPAANKGWDAIVRKQLSEIDLLKYFQDE